MSKKIEDVLNTTRLFDDKYRAKLCANFLINDFMAYLNEHNLSVLESKITHTGVAELIRLVGLDIINNTIAKKVFELMIKYPTLSPAEIVLIEGLSQSSDNEEIEKIVDGVLDDSPDQLKQYREGKVSLKGHFVGQIMKKMCGTGNPKIINEILQTKLDNQ